MKGDTDFLNTNTFTEITLNLSHIPVAFSSQD